MKKRSVILIITALMLISGILGLIGCNCSKSPVRESDNPGDVQPIDPPESDIGQKPQLIVGTGEISICTGEQFTIKYVLKNSTETVKFESNDPSIATVDGNGVVSALSVGETVIRIYAGNLSPKFCRVKVDASPIVTLKDTDKEVSLSLGKTYKLQPALMRGMEKIGEAIFAFESANPDIASVDGEGIVTANANGIAMITASCEYNKKSYSVDIKIVCHEDCYIEASDMTINLNEPTPISYVVKELDGSIIEDARAEITLDGNFMSLDEDGMLVGSELGEGRITLDYFGIKNIINVSCILKSEHDEFNLFVHDCTISDAFTCNCFHYGDNAHKSAVQPRLAKEVNGVAPDNGNYFVCDSAYAYGSIPYMGIYLDCRRTKDELSALREEGYRYIETEFMAEGNLTAKMAIYFSWSSINGARYNVEPDGKTWFTHYLSLDDYITHYDDLNGVVNKGLSGDIQANSFMSTSCDGDTVNPYTIYIKPISLAKECYIEASDMTISAGVPTPLTYAVKKRDGSIVEGAEVQVTPDGEFLSLDEEGMLTGSRAGEGSITFEYDGIKKTVKVVCMETPAPKHDEFNCFADGITVSGALTCDYYHGGDDMFKSAVQPRLAKEVNGVALNNGNYFVCDSVYANGSLQYMGIYLDCRRTKDELVALREEGYRYIATEFMIAGNTDSVMAIYFWWSTINGTHYNLVPDGSTWISYDLSLDDYITHYDDINGVADKGLTGDIYEKSFMATSTEDPTSYHIYIKPIFLVKEYYIEASDMTISANVPTRLSYAVKKRDGSTVEGAEVQVTPDGEFLSLDEEGMLTGSRAGEGSITFEYEGIKKTVKVVCVETPASGDNEFNSFADDSTISGALTCDYYHGGEALFQSTVQPRLAKEVDGVALEDGNYFVCDSAYANGSLQYMGIYLDCRRTKDELIALKEGGYKYIEVEFMIAGNKDSLMAIYFWWSTINGTHYNLVPDGSTWISYDLSLDDYITHYDEINGVADKGLTGDIYEKSFMATSTEDPTPYHIYIKPIFIAKEYYIEASDMTISANVPTPLSYAVKNHDGSIVEGAEVQITPDGEFLSIDEEGMLTGSRAGEGSITFEYSGIRKTVKVVCIETPESGHDEFNGFADDSAVSGALTCDYYHGGEALFKSTVQPRLAKEVDGVALEEGNYFVCDSAYANGSLQYMGIYLDCRRTKDELVALKEEGYKYIKVEFMIAGNKDSLMAIYFGWSTINGTHYNLVPDGSTWISYDLSLDDYITHYDEINGVANKGLTGYIYDQSFMGTSTEDPTPYYIYIKPIMVTKDAQ